MTDIKLARLPDRTPVKIAIAVMPDLAAALADYALLYEQTYAETVSVTDLIPAMLESFLASDRAFGRRRSRPPEVRT
ncbi:DUF2274 domain-containing protein [Sphingomonas adhaesiva]|uniref:DUF2274 domain-containing protein n=1 Tax=Sphingomonas adhaesiva TaxID=28212 RepID=UPI002FF446F8